MTAMDDTSTEEIAAQVPAPRRPRLGRLRAPASRFVGGGATLALVERLLAAALAGEELEVPKGAADTRVVGLAVQIVERLQAVTAGVSGTASLLEAASEEMFVKTTEMSSACEVAVDHAQLVTSRAGSVADDASAVAARTRAFAEQAATLAESSLQAFEVAKQAAERAGASVELGHRLIASAGEIAGVVEIISRIAGQTRLLALNATIESARAGSAGLGFGVVAKEVKELAAQTQDATATIGARIEQVLRDADESASSFREIAAVVSRVQEMQRATAGTVQEQSAVTMDLAATAAAAAQGSEEVVAAVALTKEAVQESLFAAGGLGEQSMRLLGMSSELNRLSTG